MVHHIADLERPPQMLLAKAVQKFCKHLQVCVDKAGVHFEHYLTHSVVTSVIVITEHCNH